ncbi:uncharacterized protein LOC105779805 isoform X1 [Gossypium raimondii]|uniref:uncharacterized protein LOC105779805 isoform X1 n=1 Tax=Gossypium raimondii TaxID=29730 RepID=UPI00227B924B|nr:uncharacterized protein LOC105779805 isoform X1 [Gossypium raimondii]
MVVGKLKSFFFSPAQPLSPMHPPATAIRASASSSASVLHLLLLLHPGLLFCFAQIYGCFLLFLSFLLCNDWKDCCNCESLTTTLFFSHLHQFSNTKSPTQICRASLSVVGVGAFFFILEVLPVFAVHYAIQLLPLR